MSEFDSFDDDADRLLNDMRHADKQCILCGGAPHQQAMWVLDDAESLRLGVPARETRTVVYFLCLECCARCPASNAEAEAKIFREVAAMLKAPGAN
jgi:hypothetical protein